MTPRSRISSTRRGYAARPGRGFSRSGGSSGCRQQSRLEPLLDDAVGRGLLTPYDVGALAPRLGDRLDQLGAAVDEADAVVGAVGQAQGPVGDELVHERPAPLLGVVVNTIVIGQQ